MRRHSQHEAPSLSQDPPTERDPVAPPHHYPYNDMSGYSRVRRLSGLWLNPQNSPASTALPRPPTPPPFLRKRGEGGWGRRRGQRGSRLWQTTRGMHVHNRPQRGWCACPLLYCLGIARHVLSEPLVAAQLSFRREAFGEGTGADSTITPFPFSPGRIHCWHPQPILLYSIKTRLALFLYFTSRSTTITLFPFSPGRTNCWHPQPSILLYSVQTRLAFVFTPQGTCSFRMGPCGRLEGGARPVRARPGATVHLYSTHTVGRAMGGTAHAPATRG